MPFTASARVRPLAVTSCRFLLRSLRLIVALVALTVGLPACADGVLVLLSSGIGPYVEAAAALEQELQRSSSSVEITVAELPAAPALNRFAVIAAIGTAASEFVAAQPAGPPTVHLLLPSASYQALPAEARQGSTAVFVDQPVGRQVELLRAALPTWRTLAMLYGEATRALAKQLTIAAERRDMRVVSAFVPDRAALYPAMQQVLDEPAILLALPDPEVFNSYNVQNVLLSAYREKSPVVGFSPAYVRAGALLALYSEPTGVGRQAAAMVAAALLGRALPAPEYPRDFEVGANDRVARSLNITLPVARTLKATLIELESRQ